MSTSWMGLFVPAGYDPELLSHPQLGHLLAEFAQTYSEHLQAHGVFSIGNTAPRMDYEPNTKVDAGGNQSADYSHIPKGAGSALRSYMRDEADKAAKDDTSQLPLDISADEARRRIDLQIKGEDEGWGPPEGAIQWQRGLADSQDNAIEEKKVNTEVYGPDVASAPRGGTGVRAE